MASRPAALLCDPALLSTPRCTIAEVEACARTAGVNIVTVYRWLQRYQRSGQITALLPSERSGGGGKADCGA